MLPSPTPLETHLPITAQGRTDIGEEQIDTSKGMTGIDPPGDVEGPFSAVYSVLRLWEVMLPGQEGTLSQHEVALSFSNSHLGTVGRTWQRLESAGERCLALANSYSDLGLAWCLPQGSAWLAPTCFLLAQGGSPRERRNSVLATCPDGHFALTFTCTFSNLKDFPKPASDRNPI